MSNRFVNVNANDEINWEKRAKTLSQVLIISGALNFGLLGTFFISL